MLRKFSGGAFRARGLEQYYENKSRLDALGISLPPSARVLELQAPWAKLSVDFLTEVLVPTGYIIGTDGFDNELALLRSTWQHNNLDTAFSLAVSETLAAGASFWVLAPPDEEHEFVSIRAFDQDHAAVRLDAQDNVVEGLALYKLADGTEAATYYTPDGVAFYRKEGGRWRDTGEGRRDTWGPSIVPMVNRARLRDRYGRSEIAELRSVIDAASRTLTNLQVAQEVSALPMRILAGEGADVMMEQFPDALQAYMGKLIGAPAGTTVYQLAGANMEAFLSTYRTYALQVSAMTGIPPTALGVTSDANPTSAEALRVIKDRFIMRAENKQRQMSDSLEQVGRLIIAMNGRSTKGLEALETTWRDVAAASVSAQQANMLQAAAQGIISPETAAEYLGLTPEQALRERGRSHDVDVMSGDLS